MNATTTPAIERTEAETFTPTQEGGAAGADQLQLVSFVVGAEEFAVDILAVQEINRMMPLTRVPQSPPDVEGVINLRGKIIPVLDLRRRFEMPKGERDHNNRIVVVEVQGRVLGFVVDRVNEVLRIPKSIVDPAPTMSSSIRSDYIEGVGKLEDRLLILLNLDRLFAGEPTDLGNATAKSA